MPSGRKSIRLFYEEMIEVSKNNIGCVTDFDTIIDEKFISILEKRLLDAGYKVLSKSNTQCFIIFKFKLLYIILLNHCSRTACSKYFAKHSM